MSVRWIVFDAVGTLIEPAPDVATAYHTIGQRHGSRLTHAEVSQRFRSAFQADESGDRSTHRLTTDEETEKDRWRRIVATVFDDVPDAHACFQDLFDHFGHSSSWRCFDDVFVTLPEIAARGFRLAIASNFDRRLHAICDELGPLPLLETRIISSEIGWRKPAGEFYRTAADMLAAPVESILVVGDDELNDVIGSRSAGMRAIHLDRSLTTHQCAGQSGDSPISSLTELLERLT